MKKRAVFFFIITLFAFCGLITRVYHLTNNGLENAAEQQATTTVVAANSRGTIYDCRLRPLVNTGVEYRACIAPFPDTIARLSELLQPETFNQLGDRLKNGRPIAAVMEEELSPVNGLVQFASPVRYGERLYAPHLIGYMDGDGLHGATGMEQVFDELLNQCAGKASVTYTVDGAGHTLSGVPPVVENTLGLSAGGVALTIDRDIQAIVERAAPAYLTKGAVVVMDTKTGNLLALASFPSFQPDTVADCLDDKNSPLLNRAICNYNCGSVFKIVSAAAALEAGVPTSRSYVCNGSVTIEGITFHCHNRLGHGSMNMTEAFAQSCNCYFINLMQDVGWEKLYDMAVTLGFDRSAILTDGYKTARAILPSAEELSIPSALANLSFGQGKLMASPVHIAQLISTVVNDGSLLRPNLLLGTGDENCHLQPAAQTPPQSTFSASTAATLRELMIAAVAKDSTGETANPINGGAGGKTGTAETGWKTENGDVVQSWFAGFYPAENPRYAIAVLAEDSNATKGKSSPVFRRICDELYALELGRDEE